MSKMMVIWMLENYVDADDNESLMLFFSCEEQFQKWPEIL